MSAGCPEAETRYTSFDGTTLVTTKARRPERYAYWDRARAEELTIPRGAGLSYAAASFSPDAVSIEHRCFNRILAFDPDTRTIEVEAGITLGELYEFLTPRGLYLPVQPGHPSISVGGCAAADVHGKNQSRDGTFIKTIRSARLFHPSHGILELSPERNPALFRLTFGAYGLTGNILSLELAVKAIPSSWIRMETTPLDDIYELPSSLKAAAERSDLVFSWHCLTARGKRFGRGFIKEGSFVLPGDPEMPVRESGPSAVRPLTSEARSAWRVPFFGPTTTPLFNRLYGTATRLGPSRKLVPLYGFLFPVHDKISYFKLFGRRGFLEYQLIVPTSRYAELVDRMRVRLAKSPLPITLASAKLFAGQRELLRFTGDGICLALDFPDTPEARQFAAFLDETCVLLGALPNIIKDSRLPAEVVAKTYGSGYETFRHELRQFDPKRSFRSALSERLAL